MTNLQFNKNLKKKVLMEIQHCDLTTLNILKTENPSFHWCSISYEKTGDTALHIASRLGYIPVIDYLLKEYVPCAVDVRNNDDKTPLHEAAQFTQLESVQKLCFYGSEVNALRRGDWTSLMLACTRIEPEISLSIVKTLVERGADKNISNKDGWTCVHLLAREGGQDIFDYLVAQGLKVDKATKNGRTPLHIAALHGNIQLVSRFLLYLDVNSKDGCGNTPLQEALLGQHIDVARLLVEQGADVYLRNNSDLSVLHLAASNDNPDIIDYILNELNYDINLQNKNGWTVAHCTARKGSNKVFKHLEKIGADLSIKDNFERTAMDYFLL